MIDWHCHILPALDDGPETLNESLEMARILAFAGFRQVCCTPHCLLGRYDTRPSQVSQAVAVLQGALQRADIPLTLIPGMEYALDEYFPVLLDDPRCLGDSRLLLVEAPRKTPKTLIQENIRRILQRGLIPLLAHPERSPCLYHRSSLWGDLAGLFQKARHDGEDEATAKSFSFVQELKNMGCLFQGNLPSFAGRYGLRIERRTQLFLERGLYRCFGSDGHRAETLKADLAASLPGLRKHL